MKKALCVLAILALVCALAACGTTKNYTAEDLPETCQVSTTTTSEDGTETTAITACTDSFILNHFSRPGSIKSAVGAAVLLAVKAGKTSAANVMSVTANVRSFLAADNTYSGLGSLITSVVNSDEIDTIVTVLEVTGIFSALADMTSVQINACDADLLEVLLDYIDALVKPYAA